MKALVKSRAERGLWLEEIAVPQIGTNDVLVRVFYTGICGTDVHTYEWDKWAQETIPVPMAIGHEFAGEAWCFRRIQCTAHDEDLADHSWCEGGGRCDL